VCPLLTLINVNASIVICESWLAVTFKTSRNIDTLLSEQVTVMKTSFAFINISAVVAVRNESQAAVASGLLHAIVHWVSDLVADLCAVLHEMTWAALSAIPRAAIEVFLANTLGSLLCHVTLGIGSAAVRHSAK